MGKIPGRWAPRGRATSRRRSIPPSPPRSVKPTSSRSSRISKPEKKPSSSRRRTSMDIVEGINRWLPYVSVGRRIAGTRLLAFKVPLKSSYVRRLEERDQFTVEALLDSVPELGMVIDLTQTDRYYNKQEILKRGVDYCKLPCPGQQIPPEDLVIRFFNAIDYYLDHHAQDNTVVGVHCTHGVNRTGYMLARYLIQRLGIPVREAVMCIASARNHEIERKPYIHELERHTNLIAKESSSKDIQFSRMRSGGLAGPPPTAGLASPPPPPTMAPPHPESWRASAEKVKTHKSPSPPPRRRSPSQKDMLHLSRTKFNGQVINESRNKEPREFAHKFTPGYDNFKEPMMGYREEMWDGKEVMRSRGRNSRSRERDFCGAPRSSQTEERGMPRDALREVYEDRYRHRASPPPQHFEDRPVIEEARRGYRGERPDIPLEHMDKPRGYPPEDYMRPLARDRPPSVENVPYDHSSRMSRYGGSDRYRNERRPFMEYDRPRPREEMRAPHSPHFSGRYSPSPPPYARGMESGAMPFMANRRMDDPSRQFEPDLPVGGRRMESDMPVGGRRINESIGEVPPPARMHLGEDSHVIRGRMDDVHMNRGRMNDEMAMIREPIDLDRPMNREMGDHFRDRREYRRSPSPGRPRSGYLENYEPRGGEVPPYGMGAHIPERYGSPMRPPPREPIPDSDMRRMLVSPPRQPWNPVPEYARQALGDGPPYRDYGPSRREPPPFRGNDEPPPPGIEAEMRREIEERGRKRSPTKPSRSRRSRSPSRSKVRSSISPKKLMASKQREPSGSGRIFPPSEERGRHPEERMGASWPPRGSPAPASSGPPPPAGREVWIDDHPPVRSRIDDGPDCRLIINKKRSSAYSEENEPLPVRASASSSGREERRHISPPRVVSDRDRGMHLTDDMRDREMNSRMKYIRDSGNDRARGGGGPPSRRAGPPHQRMHSGPPDRMTRGSGRESKKPVFDRLDTRRGPWPR